MIPNTLKPAYVGWMKAAHFFGRIVTFLILIIVYYLVITPSAMIKRIFGGTPIPLKPNKDSSSYWMTRPESLQLKERFVKRY